jgi:hypothetical protein
MQKKLLNEILRIIENNLGESASKSYKKFYSDKEDSIICASITELLTELVGPKNAEKQLAHLNCKCKKNKN